MSSCDVGIVSISKGVSKVAFPSKSIMYMSVGLPVLAILDRNSELSNLLESNNFGIAVEPNSSEIEKGVNLILEQLEMNKFSRSLIRTYAEENYSKTVITEKLTNLMLGYK